MLRISPPRSCVPSDSEFSLAYYPSLSLSLFPLFLLSHTLLFSLARFSCLARAGWIHISLAKNQTVVVTLTVTMAGVKNVRTRVLYRLEPNSVGAVATADLQNNVASPQRLVRDASQVPSAVPLAPRPSALPSTQVVAGPSVPTPSQVQRQHQSLRARADAGETEARLQMMSPADVEWELRNHGLPDKPDVSIWDYLNNPGPDVSPIQAASDLLAAAADRAESASVQAAYIWRWVKINNLWDTHPDPNLRSEQAFIDSVANHKVVKVMVVVGTSAQWSKENHRQSIAEKWGDDWLDTIPASMRPAESVKDLSKRMLSEVAITSANVPDQQQAVIGWRLAIERRLDPANRPPRTRILKTCKLIPEDVKFFNSTMNASASSVWEDVLELMPVVPITPQQKPTSAVHTKDSSRKRKRIESDDLTIANPGPEPTADTEGLDTGPQDAAAAADTIHRDGESRIKKVRGHRVIEPVTPPCDSPTADLLQLLEDIPLSSFDNKAVTPAGGSANATTCDGPEFARLFAKFAEIYAYFEKHGTSSSELVRNCCDSCRDYALRALACLKADLVPSVAGLEQVRRHAFGNQEVAPSQTHDGTAQQPAFHLRKSNHLLRVVQDSSDEESEEMTMKITKQTMDLVS